jgi:hypothetical protein
MSNAGDSPVQPRSNVAIHDATKIANACNLKNNDPVVVAERADVQKMANDITGGPWCLNDPEREQRATPICRRF